MFYEITGSVLGTYEGIAAISKRTDSVPTIPTVSNLVSRHPVSRTLFIMWTIGLCWHIARHQRAEAILVDSQHA